MKEDKKKKVDIKKWCQRIYIAREKLKEKHRCDAEKAEKHYYNDENEKNELPLFWSSVQVQRSAIYAKPPQPEIRSRQNDTNNPIAKEISKLLEEAINYQIDQSDFHNDAKRSILDYLITDLGVARIDFDTQTGKVQQPDPVTGELIEVEVITKQSVTIDHWPWKRFIYDIGKDWKECDWICYEHYMTNTELKKEYGRKVPETLTGGKEGEKHDRAVVYEVWNKPNRMVYEFIEGDKEPLRVREDPLGLEHFFDCPNPMISNMRSDKYIPQSDYVQISRQLNNINDICARIDAIRTSIKDAGFYDKSLTDLAKLETAKDGKLVPVDGLRALLGNTGTANFENVIAKLPIINQAQVLQILKEDKEDAKNELYEITGLSDIIRGATKASETATAQQIKGQWASVRLQEKQSTIASWLKAIMRLFGEVISENFTAQQLTLMTGVDVTPEMQQTMRDDLLRCYAIDIETDSTIQQDESQDKQDRMEMVNTLLPLLQTILTAVQQNVMPMDMGKAILLTAVRGFKYARSLEDMVEGMGDNMAQMQQLQQQLQDMQMQMQQMDQGYQQQLMQANQAVGQLQQELGKVNERKEMREDADKQAEVAKDYADVEKKKAETAQIWQNIQQPVQVAQEQYQAGF